MNKVFKTIHGTPVDIVKHTLSILEECPYVDIHVGTDSQNHRRHTVYSTVIAYRYGNRGVHYVVAKTKVNKIKDIWTRLWKEAEMSIEIAELISSKITVKLQIDFDYNDNAKHFSNKLVQAATGWAMSLGYKANTKGDELVAAKAADHECR
jgi:predicted RNase H-related nuclease YkuK (DUF458 family)